MKTLKESFIKAKDLDKMGKKWPNPYGLTEKDAKGEINRWPLEIITLILHETYLARQNFSLEDLQRQGLDCAFLWSESKDGIDFWESIRDERFDVFYDKYTPAKLKERLKEK